MSKSPYSLPNILTYARILAVPVIVGCFFLEGHLKSSDFARWLALIIFALASITDFFDGYLARIWKQTSAIGKMLDPIADKLLVSACLLLLAANQTIAGWSIWAAIIILCREILVSGLREYLGEMHINVPVSRLAKYKTTLQLLAIGFLIIGPTGDKFLNLQEIIAPYSFCVALGLFALWGAAILTLVTGWRYLKDGIQHLKQ